MRLEVRMTYSIKRKTCFTRAVLYFVALNGDTSIIVQSRWIQFFSL